MLSKVTESTRAPTPSSHHRFVRGIRSGVKDGNKPYRGLDFGTEGVFTGVATGIYIRPR